MSPKQWEKAIACYNSRKPRIDEARRMRKLVLPVCHAVAAGMTKAEKQRVRREAKSYYKDNPYDSRPRETASGGPAERIAPAMPVHYSGNQSEHRTKMDELFDPFHYHVAVAKQLKMDEVMRTPAAKAAMEKEWKKLRDIGCWDLTSVREYDDVRAEALAAERTVHFGRVFPICHEKHSELPPDQRVYKGRVVFQGDNVKDESSHAALFQDLGSLCIINWSF